MKWKTINQLPPTELINEPIIVYDNWSMEVTLGYCWRGNKDGKFDPHGEVILWDLLENRNHVEITHWMPLPKSP